MKKFLTLFLGATICFSGNSFAATLDLNSLYQIGVSQNEQIRIQQEKVVQARALRSQAIAAVLPHLSLLGAESYQDSAITATGSASAFTNSHKPEYKLSLSQSLFSGFRDQDTLSAIQAQIRKETILLAQAKRTLFQQIAQNYFQILLFEKEWQTTEEAIQLSKTRTAELQRRVNIGKSRTSELLSSEAQLLNLQAQKAKIKGDLDSAKLTLSNLIGTSVSDNSFDEFPISDTIPTLTLDTQKRTEIQALKEDIIYYTKLKKVAQNSRLPTLTLGANYYLKRIDFLEPIKWDTVLNLSIPLYQGGAINAQIDGAESQLIAAKKELDFQLRQLDTTLKIDYVSLNSALVQKKALESAYQKTRESYRIYQDEYRLGLINNLEVMQALTNLLDVKHSLNSADTQYKLSYVQLKIDQQELP